MEDNNQYINFTSKVQASLILLSSSSSGSGMFNSRSMFAWSEPLEVVESRGEFEDCWVGRWGRDKLTGDGDEC